MDPRSCFRIAGRRLGAVLVSASAASRAIGVVMAESPVWIRAGFLGLCLAWPVPGSAAAVDLNRVSVGELRELIGVGTVPAERIVTYRETVGQFRSVDELRDVWGVSERIIQRVIPQVTVRP